MKPREVVFKAVLGIGQGFYGPVQLLLDSEKNLSLWVGEKLKWDSRFKVDYADETPTKPEPLDATGWAEAAFDPPGPTALEWSNTFIVERRPSVEKWFASCEQPHEKETK